MSKIRRILVGHSSIDEQHSLIFDAMDEFLDDLIEKMGCKALKTAMEKIKIFSEIHFTEEESLMNRAMWDQYSRHKEMHHFFISKVNEFETKMASGCRGIEIQFFEFLYNWLTKHIANEDTKFVTFLLESKRGNS